MHRDQVKRRRQRSQRPSWHGTVCIRVGGGLRGCLFEAWPLRLPTEHWACREFEGTYEHCEWRRVNCGEQRNTNRVYSRSTVLARKCPLQDFLSFHKDVIRNRVLELVLACICWASLRWSFLRCLLQHLAQRRASVGFIARTSVLEKCRDISLQIQINPSNEY